MKLIVLKDNIDPKVLPYATDPYTPEHLKQLGLERENRCLVLERGDTRPPEEIFAAGGIDSADIVAYRLINSVTSNIATYSFKNSTQIQFIQ